MKNKTFNVSGRLVQQENNQGIAGMRVEAWDKDLIVDDALGSAITNKEGSFRITFDETYFKELFLDREPDLYFNVYNKGQLVKSTKDSVIWNVTNQDTDIVIKLEEILSKAPKETPPSPYSQIDIKQAGNIRRADALFKAMSTDFLLREQFITDPSQVMSEFVRGKNLQPETASVSNQMLYSIMSNPDLLRWLRDYSIKLKGRQPSRETFSVDFGRAVVENKGYHVLLALLRSSTSKESVYGFDEVLLPLMVGIFTGRGIFETGTEMSTGTYATEQSGTHMSTGNIFTSGTEMSTGTYATEQSGTHMSTGNIFTSGTEMSTGTYATEQSGTHMSTGNIFTSGTEMSTGTYATEQSGTHMSTGNLTGFLNSRYALVTLEALVQYSTQLRNAGALDVVFLRR